MHSLEWLNWLPLLVVWWLGNTNNDDFYCYFIKQDIMFHYWAMFNTYYSNIGIVNRQNRTRKHWYVSTARVSLITENRFSLRTDWEPILKCRLGSDNHDFVVFLTWYTHMCIIYIFIQKEMYIKRLYNVYIGNFVPIYLRLKGVALR